MGMAWDSAARLVGRVSVGLGLLLIIVGLARFGTHMIQSRNGIEALATIENAGFAGLGPAVGGQLDLSWRDASGTLRRAYGIPVSRDLSRKLKLGRPLSRSFLRIRYPAGGTAGPILIVDDVPAQIRGAGALSVAGFLALSAGSLLMLWSAIQRRSERSEPNA